MQRNAFLAFIHALAVAVALLLAADTAAAQVVPVTEGGAVSASGSSYAPAESHETGPYDCESHRRARTPAGAPPPATSSPHVCGCYFRSPPQAPAGVIRVLDGKGLPRERTVGVPLVHRVFRC